MSTPSARNSAEATVRPTSDIWAILLDQADAIADSITLSNFEQDPRWYDDIEPAVRADVRSSARLHVRRGLETLAGLSIPGDEAKHVWRDTGRRRAGQGVPMEMVLNSYTLGARVLWGALLEHQGQPGIDDADLLRAGQEVWQSLDIQNAVFIQAYRHEEARLMRQHHHRRGQILDDLLSGRAEEPDIAADAQDILGIAADQPLLCAVALGDRIEQSLRRLEERLETSGFASHWHLHHGRAVGLIPLGESTAGEQAVRAALAAAGIGPVGTARSGTGMAGVATAHLLAVRVAEGLPSASVSVADVTERLPELLVAGSPEAGAELLTTALGGLLSAPAASREVLLHTLDALLQQDNSPKHAAEQLICHRNTVLYRRDQIEHLSGRKLANPRDRLLMTLALIRWRTQSHGPPEMT